MIKIQVLGQGMIPRDLGLAPRMEPFYADRNLIYTILQTPGLKINYLHPENGKFLPLTRQNMKIVLDKFKNATYPVPGVTKPDTSKPHTPEVKKPEPPKQETPPAPQTPPVEPPKPVTPPQNQPKAEDKPAPAPEVKNEGKKDEGKVEEKKTEEKKEEKSTQGGGLKPVVGQGQNAHDKKDEKK